MALDHFTWNSLIGRNLLAQGGKLLRRQEVANLDETVAIKGMTIGCGKICGETRATTGCHPLGEPDAPDMEAQRIEPGRTDQRIIDKGFGTGRQLHGPPW